MTEIFGRLKIQKVEARRFQLLSNPVYTLDDGTKIKPAAGFQYDGGSIPRPFWSLIGICPIGSAADEGFLAHDWLYYQSRVLGTPPMTRLQADQAMLELHLHCGVPEHIALGLYMACRAGSLPFWGDVLEAREPDEDYDWFYT